LNLDRDRSKILVEKFKIEGIPCLIVLSPSLEIICSNGIEEVQGASKEALRKWSEGKSLFWSREAHEGEHTWDGTTCAGCFMNPLVGSRHGCTDKKCEIDLCETCLSKTKHEHPLVEYLIPKQKYTLQQLFAFVPYLLDPTKDEKIQTKTMWENDVKSVGFYFSAHWCPPCRLFTPKLADLYKEVQSSSSSFRIVFVSCDHDEESFNEYRAEMPWPAVPLDSGTLLKAYFQYSGKYNFLFHFKIVYFSRLQIFHH
jgi:thiol-disulfide isomerase/thioredoxin